MLGLRSFSARPLAKDTNRRFSDAELRGIRVPILVVAGEREKLCAVNAAVSRLAAVAPQIETKVFPDAGHDLIHLHTEALSESVLEFLGA